MIQKDAWGVEYLVLGEGIYVKRSKRPKCQMWV